VETVRPKAEARFRQIANKVIYVAAAPDYAQDTLIKTKDGSMIYFARAARQRDGSTEVNDLLIVEHPQKGQYRVLTADQSSLDRGIWRAKEMYVRVFEGPRLIQFYAKKDAVIDQKITVTDFFSQPQAPELDIAKLHQQIALDKSVGRDTRSMETELYTRFSIPFACVVLALCAPIFGIKFGRSGGFIGILLAALLIGGWFNLYVICTSIFGRNGWFPPMLAAWFPNIVFMVFGLIGLRRLE
jgi:lipopolysaccharide export LptBFGC system permease protein LptF